MTLFFNILRLESETNNDPTYIVKALEKYYQGRIYPTSIKEKYKPITGLQGKSFILKPEPLFSKLNVDIIHIAHYIRLAGRRNYLDYKHFNQRSLDLSLFPDLDFDTLKYNPLLEIAGNQLKFKFEEITNGNQL